MLALGIVLLATGTLGAVRILPLIGLVAGVEKAVELGLHALEACPSVSTTRFDLILRRGNRRTEC